MRKKDWIKLLGIAGTCLGAVATVISDYASDKKQEEYISNKVAEAFADYQSREAR